MKKLCIVSCFDNYESRTKYIEKYYSNLNYEVIHVVSNFHHIKKEYKKEKRKNVTFIHVPSYKRNMSIRRAISHYIYAKKAYKVLQDYSPDMVYCNVPVNSVVYFMSKIKKRKKIKLIFDVFDMWPESMAVAQNNLFLKLPLYIWRRLRDKYIDLADCVVTECDLFKNILNPIVDSKKMLTIYIAREKTEYDLKAIHSMDAIHLCYLGSINNIINIELICKVIHCISEQKLVVLHLIGGGESKETFVDALKSVGAEVVDYGIVYDEQKKHDIMSLCHFGINMMKESVCVGLTSKSTCYFEAGLPVINNLPEDSTRLIKQYGAGYNIDKHTYMQICQSICNLSLADYCEMRKGAKNLYNNEMSMKVIYSKIEKMDQIVNGNS